MDPSVGVLIIGSLYWDDRRTRKLWRESRLATQAGCMVSAPIRYGRCSPSRGNTYTMVFSRGCALGQARVIRCKRTVSSPKDLTAEAEHLWTAERSAESSNHQISADWGCVALLVRPGCEIPQEFLDAWAEGVSREPDYGRIPQTSDEGILVDEFGVLQIAWPKLIGRQFPVPLDLLLATANDPTLQGDPATYPSPKMIADAWGIDTNDRISYFRKNRACSIVTFEDQAILDELRRDFPEKVKGLG